MWRWPGSVKAPNDGPIDPSLTGLTATANIFECYGFVKISAVPTPSKAHDPSLRDRVKNALDETRTMILGTQVLLGFQYQLLFYPGFARMPSWGKILDAVSLGLTILTCTLLLACIPYHRVAEGGNDTMRLVHHASLMAAGALATTALALGADFALVLEHAMSPSLSLWCGALALLICLGCWFFHGMLVRRRPREHPDGRVKASLNDRIALLLTESRVILPGCQALLGIQFVAVFSDGFEHLPPASRAVHLICLALLALAMVMLLAPAAYHRLAAGGDASEDTDRFGVRMILGSLVPLALGMTGDFYVVVTEVTGSALWGGAWSFAILSATAGLWLVWPLAARRQR